jgi:hypothetical protein
VSPFAPFEADRETALRQALDVPIGRKSGDFRCAVRLNDIEQRGAHNELMDGTGDGGVGKGRRTSGSPQAHEVAR